MRVRGAWGIMAIRIAGIGWGLVGNAMVNGRGRNGVEQFFYGGSFVGMGTMNRAIHRWWGGPEGQGDDGQAGFGSLGEEGGRRSDYKGEAKGKLTMHFRWV
jgi:hypothetical protein